VKVDVLAVTGLYPAGGVRHELEQSAIKTPFCISAVLNVDFPSLLHSNSFVTDVDWTHLVSWKRFATLESKIAAAGNW